MQIKAKSLINKTAKDLDLSEEFVSDVVNFYYEELRDKMENLKEPRIRVPEIGVFYISKNKLEDSIRALTYLNENREVESSKGLKKKARRDGLLKIQKEALTKIINSNKEYEFKKGLG